MEFIFTPTEEKLLLIIAIGNVCLFFVVMIIKIIFGLIELNGNLKGEKWLNGFCMGWH